MCVMRWAHKSTISSRLSYCAPWTMRTPTSSSSEINANRWRGCNCGTWINHSIIPGFSRLNGLFIVTRVTSSTETCEKVKAGTVFSLSVNRLTLRGKDMRGWQPSSLQWHSNAGCSSTLQIIAGNNYKSEMKSDSSVRKVSDRGSKKKKEAECSWVHTQANKQQRIPGTILSPPATSAHPDWNTSWECSTPFSH